MDRTLRILAEDLLRLQEEARVLRLFDRELLSCLNCGLLEDVLVNGNLITYFEGTEVTDRELRFAEENGSSWKCPN